MALTCTINGTQYEMLHDFEISEQVGNKTSSTISVLVESQPVPVAGDVIEIMDGATCVFWGLCGIPTSPKYAKGTEKKIYKIVCSSANALMANRLVNEAYQDKSIEYIVRDLLAKYISAEGITEGTISTMPTELEAYVCSDYNLQTALNELADMVGAVWEITHDKEFNFVVINDFPEFPHEINDSFLIGSDLQHKTTDYNLRTVQYITGAEGLTSQQDEQFTYVTDQDSFSVSFPIRKKPKIKRNGTSVSSSRIGVAGIDSETGKWFMWSAGSTTVRYVTSSGALSNGATVNILYYGTYPIHISVQDADAIASRAQRTGTSGIVESVYQTNTSMTTAGAIQLAQSLIDQFCEALGEVSFYLLSSQLYALGMTLDDVALNTMLHFNIAKLGIVGDYVITERSLTPAFADMSDHEEKYKVVIRARSRAYLKSYAETLSDLQRETGLNIRGDETIVNGQLLVDTMDRLAESNMTVETVYPYRVINPYASPTSFDRLFSSGINLGGDYYPCA